MSLKELCRPTKPTPSTAIRCTTTGRKNVSVSISTQPSLPIYRQSNVFSLAGASADAPNYFQDGNGYTYMFPENPGVAGNLLYVSNDTSLPTGSYYAPQKGMSEIPIKLAQAFESYSNSK